MIVSVSFKSLKGTLPAVLDVFFFMNFLHFAILIWVITGAVCVAVSLMTDAPKDIDEYTIQWKEIFVLSKAEKEYPMWINHFIVFLAALVLATTVAFCIIWG